MANLRPAVLRAESITVTFPGGVEALRELRLEVTRGDLLAIVGESGAGKTTLLRALAGLVEPTSGMVRLRMPEGWRILADLGRAGERRLRGRLQVSWQDARDALDPAMTVERAVAQGYSVGGAPGVADPLEAARALLRDLDIGPEQRRSPPARCSGGECRRVVLARALAALGYVARSGGAAGASGDDKILLLDEPMAALDPPRRRRVLAVLHDARTRLGLSIALVTHDLALARDIADRVAVMYQGTVIEAGKREDLFDGDGRFLGEQDYSRKLAESLAARDSALGPGFHSED